MIINIKSESSADANFYLIKWKTASTLIANK